jgi:hippurate hydrolase
LERLSDLAVQEFIALRRDIHRHPELAFNEHRTSALVADKLRAWGYEVTTGLGGTGVVGRLHRGTSTRAIGLRADMDALPIEEATGADWTSCHHGVMHACGHDGHTATLLAAAQHLATQGTFEGTLNLIFQPAEEGGGGALKMMEDGLFDRFPCDAIFAMHNMPGYEQGQLIFRSGPTMASSDYATVTLHGVGGHGAMPHHAADPVVAAASIVMALQTIVSRGVDRRGDRRRFARRAGQ